MTAGPSIPFPNKTIRLVDLQRVDRHSLKRGGADYEEVLMLSCYRVIQSLLGRKIANAGSNYFLTIIVRIKSNQEVG